MHRLKSVVIGSAVTALAITSLGAPVAADDSKTRLSIVNGFPGQRVDVCINGKEVRSRMPYGGRIYRTTHTSKALVKFFKPDRRKCKGRLVGKSRVTFDDATVVVTKKAWKKVVTFENPLGLGMQTAAISPDAAFTLRYAGDMGPVVMNFSHDFVFLNPWTPATSHHIWRKGAEYIWNADLAGQDIVNTLYVESPTRAKTYIGPQFLHAKKDYRHEMVVVGTRKAPKVVRLKRPIVFP